MKNVIFLFALVLASLTVQGQTESEAAYVRVGIAHEGGLSVGDKAKIQMRSSPKRGGMCIPPFPVKKAPMNPP